MSVWYRAYAGCDKIEIVNVSKVNKKTLVVTPGTSRFRRSRVGKQLIHNAADGVSHFQTFEEAKQHLVKACEQRVESAKYVLERDVGDLEVVRLLAIEDCDDAR